jgi:hypothetical protein
MIGERRFGSQRALRGCAHNPVMRGASDPMHRINTSDIYKETISNENGMSK